jgi:hypothetical protein
MSARRFWRRALFMPLATAAAVAAAALIVLASPGSGPSAAQAARFALERATMTTPASPTDHAQLALRAAAVRFPAYLSTLGWVATGARRDRIDDRTVTTVFYRAQDGTRIGYAIVSGAALDPPGGPRAIAKGTHYAFGQLGSAHFVTWRAGGHTCMIVGRRPADRELLDLASAGAR